MFGLLENVHEIEDAKDLETVSKYSLVTVLIMQSHLSLSPWGHLSKDNFQTPTRVTWHRGHPMIDVGCMEGVIGHTSKWQRSFPRRNDSH